MKPKRTNRTTISLEMDKELYMKKDNFTESEILIQVHLTVPTFIEEYFMKDGSNKVKKISKKKFFDIYDSMNSNKSVKILPPITKELNVK